jgi:hypothetical protein
VRIGLISYHPSYLNTEVHGWCNPTRLGQYAMTLAQQGHQVQWVSSPDTVDAYVADVSLIAEQADSLPETCRYVVPCQLYRLHQVWLYCIDRAVWQERPLHTRLFTFLCLLQREVPCQVLHAWGAFPGAYLAVYVGRLVGVPAVVSYDTQSLNDGPHQAFEWQWVARHVSRALVASDTHGELLAATSDAVRPRLQVVPTEMPAAVAALTQLYASLHRSETL